VSIKEILLHLTIYENLNTDSFKVQSITKITITRNENKLGPWKVLEEPS